MTELRIEATVLETVIERDGAPTTVVEHPTSADVFLEGPVWVPPSSGSDAHLHLQEEAAMEWTIDHALPFRPSVTVVDETGRSVLAGVEFVSSSRIVITHAEARSGSAYLS